MTSISSTDSVMAIRNAILQKNAALRDVASTGAPGAGEGARITVPQSAVVRRAELTGPRPTGQQVRVVVAFPAKRAKHVEMVAASRFRHRLKQGRQWRRKPADRIGLIGEA